MVQICHGTRLQLDRSCDMASWTVEFTPWRFLRGRCGIGFRAWVHWLHASGGPQPGSPATRRWDLCGTPIAGHALRASAAADPGCVTIQLDSHNVFNTLPSEWILAAVSKRACLHCCLVPTVPTSPTATSTCVDGPTLLSRHSPQSARATRLALCSLPRPCRDQPLSFKWPSSPAPRPCLCR
jgi:hypothetical protein